MLRYCAGVTVVGAAAGADLGEPQALEEAVEESVTAADPVGPAETATPGVTDETAISAEGPFVQDVVSTAAEGVGPRDIDLRLAGLVVELMDRTRQAVREVGEEEGLSIPQLDVLRRLREGPSPMRRLAVQMNCEASNLTGLVDRLESRGLVERQPHPEDRRVKCVGLTEAGEQLGREVWSAVAGRCELNRLSEPRKVAVAAALRDAMRTGEELELRPYPGA